MLDVINLSQAELTTLRKKLKNQLADLQQQIAMVNTEIAIRDAVMMETQAEQAYQRGKKPVDPPTLRQYWEARRR